MMRPGGRAGVTLDRTTSETFHDYLARGRADVERAIADALPGPPECPPLLAEAMRYSLEAGGKRLRPALALAAAEAVAARPPSAGETGRAGTADEARRRALPAACAIELIHTYSLIHDDLPAMDDDTMRRGRPTLHVVYGEGIAILAGDGLLTQAFAVLARAADGADADGMRRVLRATARVADAAGVAGMVGGQAIDLEAAGTTEIPGRPRPILDGNGLSDMHRRKTGALIRASAVTGAILAGASDAEVEAIDRFAAEVGLVFQIVDDILDVEGASDALGKTAGKDAAAGKPTYPALYGLERSRALAAEGIGRATAALENAGIPGGRLIEIARWVIGRSN
jgi:geranylgeranyl diphosphate synthase type II